MCDLNKIVLTVQTLLFFSLNCKNIEASAPAINFLLKSATLEASVSGVATDSSGNIYNVSNEACHMTIREMAELAAREFSAGRSKVVVDIPEDIERLGYAQDVKMRLSSAKLRQLGWQPRIDLTEAYRRMLIYMKEQSR